MEGTSKPVGAPAALVLEDGAVFRSASCAAAGEVYGEICFNTSPEGYLEVITDPSYAGQIIAMTYPRIGNYGVNPDDAQSDEPALRGLVVRDMCAAGVECEQVKKIHKGEPNVRDMIAVGDIALMINTPFGHATRADCYELRLEAVKHGVTHVTNLAGAQAMVAGMEVARASGLSIVALQDLPQWEAMA